VCPRSASDAMLGSRSRGVRSRSDTRCPAIAVSPQQCTSTAGPYRSTQILADGDMAPAFPATTPLTTNLRRLGGRPFGVDDEGRPIRVGTGRFIAGAIQHLNEIVRSRTLARLPADLPESQREARVSAAQAEALAQLVDMLNEAI